VGAVVVLALPDPGDRSLRRRFSRSATAIPAPVADANRGRTLTAILLCFAFIALAVTVLLMFSSASFWVISSDASWFVRSTAVVSAGCRHRRRDLRDRRRRYVARTDPEAVAVDRQVAAGASCLVWAYVAVAFHFLAIHLQY
jgi:hypothetical protein